MYHLMNMKAVNGKWKEVNLPISSMLVNVEWNRVSCRMKLFLFLDWSIILSSSPCPQQAWQIILIFCEVCEIWFCRIVSRLWRKLWLAKIPIDCESIKKEGGGGAKYSTLRIFLLMDFIALGGVCVSQSDLVLWFKCMLTLICFKLL